jgi:DNA-directed RNA polymerase specialized sigma subunit
MKIPLNIRQEGSQTTSAEQEKNVERDVAACRRNDWEAKTRLVQRFMPLLASLARKRASEIPAVNRLVDAGKEGLQVAVQKFRPGHDGKFQIFAVTHIEAAMDKAGRPGFLARLFGRG